MSERTIGPYQIIGELGRGAMAVVWRGFDPKLEREVAIKEPVIAPGTNAATASELAARFVREGQAAARLSHPGIVTIYGADIYDGRPAIIMELIEGETLGAILERGALSQPQALAVLDQLLDAIGYAHARGIVHRDVKPDNVFVTLDGRVKLTDFGIAHLGSTATLTQAGTVMGTPGYMAPEQVTGQPVDARADIFAAAAIGYEMLTGTNPFGATDGLPSTTVMYRIVHEQTPVLQTAPAHAGQAIMAALAKQPHQRFADAASFRAALSGTPVGPGGAAVAATVQFPGVVSTVNLAPTVVVPQAASAKSDWWPYALVGGVGVVLLGALLLSAGGSPGGTAGSGLPGGAPATSPESASSVAPAQSEVAVELQDPIDGTRIQAGDVLELAANVTGSEIVEVEFLVDGATAARVQTAPFAASITLGDSGNHTIEARATTADGSETRSGLVTVEVEARVADSPEATVQAYYDACNDHDLAEAYSFFSSDRQSSYSIEEYEEQAFRFYGRGDVINLASEVNGSSAIVWAELTIVPANGGSSQPWSLVIDMVKEGGEWRIARMRSSE